MRLCILLADDSLVARLLVSRLLRAEGLEVEEHDSATGASGADVSTLACALLDLELGDGLGTDVAARLREGDRTLPIAFFTSTSAPEALTLAKAFGPVFAKPAELEQAVAWAYDFGRR